MQLAAVPPGIEAPEWERLCELGASLWEEIAGTLVTRGVEGVSLAWEEAAAVGEGEPAELGAGVFSRASVVSTLSGSVALVAAGELAKALVAAEAGAPLLDAIWEAAGARLARDLGIPIGFAAAPPIDGSPGEVNEGLAQIFPEGEALLALRGRVSAPAALEGAFEIRLTTALARQLAGHRGQPEAAAGAAAAADEIGRAILADAGAWAGTVLGPMDGIELEIAARLGEVEMKLEDVLRLGPGTVIELDRRVEDPVDVMVHGRVIARADVVVVGEKFALRIQELVVNK